VQWAAVMIQASEMKDPPQKYLAVTMAEDNLLRLNGFFFLLSFSCGIPRPTRRPRPQDVGHLCFGYCFDSKVGPGAPLSVKSPHGRSNLKSHKLGNCKKFNPFYNLNCSA
jgi:hypothetical protein